MIEVDLILVADSFSLIYLVRTLFIETTEAMQRKIDGLRGRLTFPN
jgi:hypothetical protein